MKTFNLQKYMKTAFYEDVRGYMNGETRSFQNCYKVKSDKGMSPHEAWSGCLKDFQTAISKSDWVLSYTSDKDDTKMPYFDSKTPAAQKIIKK